MREFHGVVVSQKRGWLKWLWRFCKNTVPYKVMVRRNPYIEQLKYSKSKRAQVREGHDGAVEEAPKSPVEKPHPVQSTPVAVPVDQAVISDHLREAISRLQAQMGMAVPGYADSLQRLEHHMQEILRIAQQMNRRQKWDRFWHTVKFMAFIAMVVVSYYFAQQLISGFSKSFEDSVNGAKSMIPFSGGGDSGTPSGVEDMKNDSQLMGNLQLLKEELGDDLEGLGGIINGILGE